MSGLQGALLDTLLKGSLLLVLAAVATRLLRHRSAAARHAIWTTALLAQLALPVLSVGLPAWSVPLLPAAVPAPALIEQPVAAPLPAPAVGSALVHSLHSVQFWLTLLWIAGGIALLMRLVVGLATVARLARRAGEVGEGAWQSLTRYLAATLRIRRPIRLLRSDRVGVPITWGVRRPTVLLPADADDWSADRRGLVLVHELAHIKRLDALTQLAAQGTLALFWINPLVWVALRQMAAERERACDDYVLRCGAVASTYAGELLEIVRSLRRSPGPVLAALALGLARRSEFESRMLAILNPGLSRRALDRRGTLLLGAFAVLLVVPLAAFRPVPRKLPTSGRVAAVMAPVGRMGKSAPVADPDFDALAGRDLARVFYETAPVSSAAGEAPLPLAAEGVPLSRRAARRRAIVGPQRSQAMFRQSEAAAPSAMADHSAMAGIPPLMPDSLPWFLERGTQRMGMQPVVCLTLEASTAAQQHAPTPVRNGNSNSKVPAGVLPLDSERQRSAANRLPRASSCKYTVRVLRSDSSTDQDLRLTLVREAGKSAAINLDTLRALEYLLQSPEVIVLLQYLASPKET